MDFQTKFVKSAIHHCPEPSDPKSIGVRICGHNFHIDCIERWLFEYIFCPLCAGQWKYFKIILLKIRDV